MLRNLVILIIIFSALLLAACQPIDSPSAEVEAHQQIEKQELAVPPGFIRYDLTDLGVSVAFPEGWIVRQDPKYDSVKALSEQPDWIRGYTAAYWMPAFEEPITSVNIQMRDADDFAEESLNDIVLHRFKDVTSAEFQINPKGGATVVSGPDPIAVGELEGVQLVVEGIDGNLQFPFRGYITALQNGDRIAFLASSMTEANEAEQLPVVEQIASTLTMFPQASPAPMTDRIQTRLALDEMVNGSLPATGPTEVMRDLWPFSGNADQQMTLIVVPTGDQLDLVIDVLDGDGNSILGGEWDDLAGQTGTREKITFNLPADGDYMAVARGAFQTAGDYQLTLYDGFRAY